MNQLSVGFARVNITPMMGIGIVGYFVPRFADGVLDDLYINALALEAGGEKAVVLTLDNCGIGRDVAMDFVASISEATGIPAEAVILLHDGGGLVEVGVEQVLALIVPCGIHIVVFTANAHQVPHVLLVVFQRNTGDQRAGDALSLKQ